jgi:organic hydroperoxide reductase OsmC/OhrA
MPTYKTKVVWKGDHWGELICGNGPQMKFSAPPSLHGHPNVMTPEDAFVAALNMCFLMMFLWATERYKIALMSYDSEAEGFVEDLIDRTSIFTKIILRPRIMVRDCSEEKVRKALNSALKYSLVAQSIKGQVIVEPQIAIEKQSRA